MQYRPRPLAAADAARARAAAPAYFTVLRRICDWLGPAALGLALAAGMATVLAPAALIAAAGVGMIVASAPDKNLADAGEALAEGNVSFVDRFTRLNTARWQVSDGWSNGAWMENDWQAEQVAVTPEGLDITLSANPPGADKPFSSGEIATHESYLYGYYEARMRAPRGGGIVVGFFTFTRPEGRASWHEIDMELLGRDPRWLEVTHHVEGRARHETIVLPFAADDGFHTYAFEWRPDVLRWYVDGVLVHEARDASVQRLRRPQRFFVNLWSSRELYRWVGRLDASAAPWTLTIACIARAPEYRGVPLC